MSQQPQSLSQLLKVKIAQTGQMQPSPNAPVPQVKNNAGGIRFQISPEKQLDRFLVLGTLGGTYYQNQEQLTKQNMDSIKDLIKSNGEYVVGRVVEISHAGRARNNDYALLVLALCFAHGNEATKSYAREALPRVARTGTHLMHFVGFVNDMRGWGSSLKKAVAGWYNQKTADDIAFQAVKYQQRDGWSQRDILRLAHPKTDDVLKNNVFKYITKGQEGLKKGDAVPDIIAGFEMAKTATLTSNVVSLIRDYGLSMEMIPTQSRNEPAVWEALMSRMGATAMLRNLNKMTSVGLIAPRSDASLFIADRFHDREWLRRARLHPLQILVARKIYAQGYGDKGSLTWSPEKTVLAALEDAFYLSFDSIIPSGKKTFKAIDVSGSMNGACAGAPQITCREAAAVLAMVSVRCEQDSVIYGFDHEFRDLGITSKDSLDEVCTKTYSRRFGSTDCAVPMLYAAKAGIEVDQFEVYTDNETYFGSVHPFEAVEKYRKKMLNPHVGLAVVSMTASQFSIANPCDLRMMDLIGFDTATPSILSDFAAGVI